MSNDQIDQIITEFSKNDGFQNTLDQTVTRMAGEISRLRHTQEVVAQDGERTGGCWVSYSYADSTHITAVHGTEVEALRYALDNQGSGVIYLPYNITLLEALKAKENPQLG